MEQQYRSKIMRLAWQIQKRRNSNRSKSLAAAWAIYQNDDIAVQHLVRKHAARHSQSHASPIELTLFQ